MVAPAVGASGWNCVHRDAGAVKFRCTLHAERMMSRTSVLATPADVAGTLLRDVNPASASVGRDGIRAVAVVSLGYRREDIGHSLNGFGFLAPRSRRARVGAVWELVAVPGRAPAGHALLTSFVGERRSWRNRTVPGWLKLVHGEGCAGAADQCCAGIFACAGVRRALRNTTSSQRPTDGAREVTRRPPGLFFVGNYLRGRQRNCVSSDRNGWRVQAAQIRITRPRPARVAAGTFAGALLLRPGTSGVEFHV